ncbi:methyltransferase-like protein 27 [Branchiostoma floridae]|uniref:Methyltransferase-like protein 27 n=1 Tax=Branchiostoma floridae TaxID=7739 RepID=A0A9J7NBX5_BRAFL|nr:methyltransferase-like protein 27 [Branchiostoma floridae]
MTSTYHGNIMAGLPLFENTALGQMRDGMTKDEMVAQYDSFAELYDEETAKRDYQGPRICAEALAKWLGDRKSSCILDVAAGTGLCAEELRKLGFTSIDGLDPSQRSLDYAMSKNRYNKYICDFVGANRTSNIDNDSYDAVSCCGGFILGAMEPDCLPDLIRFVRPGGYVCITTRNNYLTTVKAYSGGKLEAAMLELQNKGFWEQVSRDVVPGYHPGIDAVIFVYRVLR